MICIKCEYYYYVGTAAVPLLSKSNVSSMSCPQSDTPCNSLCVCTLGGTHI